MDKHSKYRGEVREHFYGSKQVIKRDKNGHRIPSNDDRLRRERPTSKENTNRISTETFIKEDKDYRAAHSNCPPGRCLHGQYERAHRVPDPIKLSRNYDIDYQYHQPHHQNYCQHHNPRKLSPNSRNTHAHSRDSEPRNDKADGGGGDKAYHLYKNCDFREPSSCRVEQEQVSGPVDDKEFLKAEYSYKHYQTKEPSNYYDKARAHCIASDEKFRQQYTLLSDDSSSSKKPSQNTVISAKSGKDLRSIIRSQIEMQQAFDQSLMHPDGLTPKRTYQLNGDDKKDGDRVSALRGSGIDMKSSLTTKKPSNLKRQPEDIGSISGEPVLDKLSPVDLNLKSAIFTVSADDIVSSKVIEPMIRKIQRMYLNTLQEEMSIMEYLEKVPGMVSEVYRREAAERDMKKSSVDK